MFSKKINKILSAAFLCASTISLSSCSVGMALSGKKDPDLTVIKQGADRGEVEIQLGSPKKVNVSQGNTIAVYEYEIGNESSPGRAVAHGAMDVLTIGLWEVVGTPVEACTGKKYEITITYDKNDKVISTGRPR